MSERSNRAADRRRRPAVSKTALGLLAVAALAAALIAQVAPWVVWLSYAFLAIMTAAMLERRALAGRRVGRVAVGVAALVGSGGAAAYGVSDTLAPIALGASGVALAALLVAVRHEGGRLTHALGSRASFYGFTATILTLSVLCIVVVVNILVARRPWQLDLTMDRVHSLSPESLSVLRKAPRPIRLFAFFRPEEAPARDRLMALLRRYERASEQVRVSVHSPDRQPGLVARLGVRAAGARLVVVAGKGSARILPGGRALSVMNLRSPGHNLRFREYTEADVTNGILRASRPATPICFATGHQERRLDDDRPGGYAAWSRVLRDHNFEPVVRSLGKPRALERCRAVVIAGPRAALFPPEIEALRLFLQAGGGLFLLAEPGGDPGLDPLLAEYGIALGAGSVTDPRGEGLGPAVVVPARIGLHPVTTTLTGSPGLPLYLDHARPVNAVGKRAKVLLESARQAWAGPEVGDAFRPGRDRRGPLPLAVAAARGKGRVVVAGDTEVAANRFVTFAGNRLLAVGAVRWLAGEEALLSVKPHSWRHSRMLWTKGRRRLVRIVTQGVLPGLAIFIGIYLWRTRRRL